jgi:hypothetical protein
LFLTPLVANTNLIISLTNKLIDKGVIDGWFNWWVSRS